MIDSIISLAATIVNIYVLYTLYMRYGFPDMFNSFNGLITAGLLAASATYFIMSLAVTGKYVEEPENEAEAEEVWNEINEPSRSQEVYTPNPMHVGHQPSENGHDKEDVLTKAIASAIAKAELKGNITIDLDVPEHEITIAGHKAAVRAYMSFTTPAENTIKPANRPEVKTDTEQSPQPYLFAPPENPVEFIKRKLEQMRGGE